MQEGEHEHEPSLGTTKRPKVEIGWLLEGDLPAAERDAARDAAAEMNTSLVSHMPEFEWVIETLDRPTVTKREQIEPVRLVDSAETERDQ
ncbi:MAG: hypothetical protein P1U53_08395 [Sulfitobacter sp.]|nr:hypothetical protein [Sulfitobacter sp.]